MSSRGARKPVFAAPVRRVCVAALRSARRVVLFVLASLAAAQLAACSTQEVVVPHRIPLVEPQAPLAERDLLDVGVVVFDPGVPKGEIPKDVLEELAATGVYAHIRRLESVLLAGGLRDTLQKAGQWGSVWLIPTASIATDVIVTARILASDGYAVRVDVDVMDVSGRLWIDKTYELETAAAAYNRQRYPDVDPYQDLLNSIANDMAVARAELPKAADSLRTVGGLRYAATLSPEAFGGYLTRTRTGALEAARLPARDDPVFLRTQMIRGRERLFFETLEQYYDGLAATTRSSYDSWRQNAREQSLSLHELERATRWRTALGIAALVASMVPSGGSSSFVQEGLLFLTEGLLDMRAEGLRNMALHADELDELSLSFDDALEPSLLELEGNEHRLIAVAETQYAEWMESLRAMFLAETGASIDDLATTP